MAVAGSGVGGVLSGTPCPRARSLVPAGVCLCLGRAWGLQLVLAKTGHGHAHVARLALWGGEWVGRTCRRW